MTQHDKAPWDSEFYAGYDAGLAAAKSLVQPPADLHVLSLANALDVLARHAASMDSHDEEWHEGCFECLTMTLLSRVVGFGEQIRKTERRLRG